MNETTTRLLKKFQNEDYRYAYDEEFSYARMATQIQAIRESQQLTQKELANLAAMRQSRISELENVNYSMWTVTTLRRIARALGVRFSFKFESWGELLPEIENNNREHLERPKFEKDQVFNPDTQNNLVMFPTTLTEPITQTAKSHFTLQFIAGVSGGTAALQNEKSANTKTLVAVQSKSSANKNQKFA